MFYEYPNQYQVQHYQADRFYQPFKEALYN